MVTPFKSLNCIYQDTQIHFLLNNDNANVMVNATEMAKLFNKRIDVFLKTEQTKTFITLLEFPPNGGNSEPLFKEQIIKSSGQNGTFFHRLLAIKFAAWLDPSFEIWIYSTIEKIIFGHYKEHWDAHILQEIAKKKLEKLKNKLIFEANEDVINYFETEKMVQNAKSKKQLAISNQYKLFNELSKSKK